MLCAIALIILCQCVGGDPNIRAVVTTPPPNAKVPLPGAAVTTPPPKAKAPFPDVQSCKDGQDCTSMQCKQIAEEEAAKATCEAAPDVIATTNPQGNNLMVKETGPFCVKFNDPTDLEGFAPCPGIYDNIYVKHSTASGDNPTNPLTGDGFLHLTDDSGGSLACGTGAKYTGDWSSFKCHELCFDVKLFHDGCHSSVPGCQPNSNASGYFLNIYPYIVLQGGAPGYFRAVFKAYNFMTDGDGSSPDWRRICAPIGPLNITGDLPSNEFGYWYMAAPNDVLSGAPPIPGSPSPNTAWPTLLSDVTAIQLPIDFTGNPAERIGYDTICMKESACADPCDPKPLCYWQYDWDCEHSKDEEWFNNFTSLITPLQTYPKKTCICKILKECCADLCSIAEQEFMALLLNVAAGHLALDCGVEWCGDCIHEIKDIISMIDQLLAQSSRSDYDCSKALHLLTGINQDEILCDTVADPEPCAQTRECYANQGSCVPEATCVPSPSVACEPNFCGLGFQDCTCKMDKSCPQTGECELNGGRCIKNCQDVPGAVTCKDLCDPSADYIHKCMCEIKVPPCKQTTLCEGHHGKCVKAHECVPPFQCNKQFCDFSTDCVCMYQDPNSLPCIDVNCSNQKGKCVKDCVFVAGARECIDDYCNSGAIEPDLCSCKIEVCYDYQDACAKKKGICKVYDDCNTATSICDPDLCGTGKECVCELSRPCTQTKLCLTNGGECVPKDQCASPFNCNAQLCDFTNGCVCKIPVSPVPCPTCPPTA